MKKLNKKRLSKLVFWIIHIISVGAIIIGLLYLANYRSVEQTLLQGHKKCLETFTSTDGVASCFSYMQQLDSYNSIMERSLIFGILFLIFYWVIRWLYKYLFTEDSSESLFEVQIDNELYEKAKKIVFESGKTYAGYLQEKLNIGYARAFALIEKMEKDGIIGPADGKNPRKILKTE